MVQKMNDDNMQPTPKTLPVKLIIIIAILGTFIGLFLGTLRNNPHEHNQTQYVNLPEFKLADLYTENSFITSDDIKNNAPAIVNIWASWCSPCRREHKIISKLAKEHHIKIFGLNYKDSAENGKNFLNNHGNPYFKVANDPDGLTILKWGIRGIPETYIINKQGKITYRHTGEIQETDIPKLLSEINKASSTEIEATH